jgi:hypothetical protein
VILDRWHLQPGHDKYAFMERMVTDLAVTKVLVVCDKSYAGKANSRTGGVGTETQIITSKVYNEVAQEKFLPLIRERDGQGEVYIPTYMAARLYIDFTEDDRFNDSYEELIRNLHNAPELRCPALGKPPAHIFNAEVAAVVTAGKFQRLRDAVDKGKSSAGAVLRDYLDNLGDALEAFRINRDVDGTEPDEVVVDTITRMRPYRDEFIDFCILYADMPDRGAAYADIHAFLERILEFHYPTGAMQSYSEWWFGAHEFSSYEWVLYLIAALLRRRQYSLAARFMDDGYLLRRPHRGDTRTTGIAEFNNRIGILEDHRKNRLKLRWASLTATMVREAANHPRIQFRDLAQADTILMCRPLFLDPRASLQWDPRLSVYSESVGPLDVFIRATSPSGLHAIRDLFGCRTVTDLAQRMNDMFQTTDFREILRTRSLRFSSGIPDMMNWEGLRQHLSGGT